jgi:hypothetical protein
MAHNNVLKQANAADVACVRYISFKVMIINVFEILREPMNLAHSSQRKLFHTCTASSCYFAYNILSLNVKSDIAEKWVLNVR